VTETRSREKARIALVEVLALLCGLGGLGALAWLFLRR